MAGRREPKGQNAVRIGIDVGGTFTDFYLVVPATGQVIQHKVPSTPDIPDRAPIAGLKDLLQEANASAKQVDFIGLGTTIATNALIERTGAITGLITTKGFRDLLEIGRQKRPHLFDLFKKNPPPLVPRHLRCEVAERIAADGQVVQALDEQGVVAALAYLREQGATSIAICFLNSYAYPQHEARAAELVGQHWPEGLVTTSHGLVPEFREFERHASAVVNAYLMPVMNGYLSRFQAGVNRLGIVVEPWIMNSATGALGPHLARQRPIDTVLSGPSGGVHAASYLAGLSGIEDIITFDMGGTSTDVCLVRDGRPEITYDRTTNGLPIKTAAVDINTIGAGGSSIAWLDDGGLLHVGPQSAGADPGPACYIDGGDVPTVTDANLVLGRLNPSHLLGGRLKIDISRAWTAIEEHIGKPKGWRAHEAAAAILAVSNTKIAQAIRFVSVAQGLDPGDYALVAYGGAGPLHAAALASELGMRALVPGGPGVMCAMGVLTKDIQVNESQTMIIRDTSPNLAAAVAERYAQLEARARQRFEDSRLTVEALKIERAVDARYAGQNFELAVPVPSAAPNGDVVDLIRSGFHAEHRRIYGYDKVGSDIELVTFRLTASRPGTEFAMAARTAEPDREAPQAGSTRKTYFEDLEDFIDCPVYQRELLSVGATISGPAIIEQFDTTTVIPPEFEAHVDGYLNLQMEHR